MNYQKIPKSHWSRYLSFIKYASLKKILNFIKSLYFWKIGREFVTTKPSFLKVEISRKCTINCLYCCDKREDVFYPFELYRKLIEKLKDNLFLVSLYDIGEPLQNTDVLKYIKYANENRIGTIISSTLSIEKEDIFWENIVTSGLTKLIVAIDGVTDKIYNKYRRNGNLELAMSNLTKILTYKKIHRSKLIIEWQMLNLPWNIQEQKSAKKLATQMGCNTFRLIKEANSQRLNYKKLNKLRKRNCLLPYIILIVTAYNKVRPCYKIYNEPMEIGNLDYSSFDEIWNGKEIYKIRNKKKIQKRNGCKTCIE
ncbi:MAG: SPASM domain-containing protein [Bacteroidales bacterium]|jgi:MoaA/NifB/PqqE/SkfB family radical SAM enzyme|nr:SPASM domain-containing protein [Bacteroidales bacterium]